ncbi:MAG: phosphatidate cytidylyltransferase [Kiritimatiellia bacterium]
MNKIAKRTLAGLAVGACVLGLFLRCPLPALVPILAILAILLQLEFYQMVRRYEPVTWLGLLMGVGWILVSAATPGAAGARTCALIGLVASVPALFLLALVVTFGSRCAKPVASAGATLLGFFYVPFLLSFFLRIVQLEPAAEATCRFAMPATRAGLYALFYLIAVAKLSDTGGFAFGLAWGRHKMCPSISPNKSWEGLLGSMVFASATTCVFIAAANHFNWAADVRFWRHLTYPLAVPVGILFALLATAGDLIESRLKRECAVKDSATFMPAGMGGFLDMFDSFIFLPALAYPVLRLLQDCP